MKLTDLLTQLQRIQAEYGDLDIDLVLLEGNEPANWAELERLEVEERTTVLLIGMSREPPLTRSDLAHFADDWIEGRE